MRAADLLLALAQVPRQAGAAPLIARSFVLGFRHPQGGGLSLH